MKRRITASLALLVTWACYALALLTLADQEATRCHDFGDLAAECSAPFILFFAVLSLLFLCATFALAFLALRGPSESDRN